MGAQRPASVKSQVNSRKPKPDVKKKLLWKRDGNRRQSELRVFEDSKWDKLQQVLKRAGTDANANELGHLLEQAVLYGAAPDREPLRLKRVLDQYIQAKERLIADVKD